MTTHDRSGQFIRHGQCVCKHCHFQRHALGLHALGSHGLVSSSTLVHTHHLCCSHWTFEPCHPRVHTHQRLRVHRVMHASGMRESATLMAAATHKYAHSCVCTSAVWTSTDAADQAAGHGKFRQCSGRGCRRTFCAAVGLPQMMHHHGPNLPNLSTGKLVPAFTGCKVEHENERQTETHGREKTCFMKTVE